MTADQQDPEFDPFASVWEALRRSVEFNPVVQMGSQLQFDTIGPLVKQFAQLQPQLQFDTIGPLVKQFSSPAWQKTIHSAIQRLADAEAEDGQESAEVSWQVLSSNGLSIYVVAAYVWVYVFFWLYALRVENRGLDEFLQTTGLDPVTVATGAAGLCAKVCRRS